MAEVSDFQLPEEDEEGEDVEDLEALDSIPYWSNEFDNEDIYGSDSDSFSHHLSEFMPSDHSIHAQIVVDGEGIDERDLCFQIGDGEGPDSDSVADVNYFRREDQVNFVMDLFERRADRSRVLRNDNSGSNPFSETLIDSSFRVLEGNREINADYVELGLDLGLGLGFNKHGEEDEDGGFMIAEGEGEFFVGRRASVSESGESSTIHAVGPFRDGLRVVGIDSESDEEEEGIVGIDVHTGDDDGLDRVPDDLGSPLCWDCLRLEDQRDTNEDFEWEEVDERVDEREVLNMLIDADEDRSVSTEIQSEAEAGVGIEEAIINLEWEVLLAVNNLERNPELEHDSESYLADHEDYIYPAEYEMLFGQFAENESSLKGSPPAARSVVNNLPSILLTQEDVQNNNALCAVCKDDISTEEQAKQLPCSHHYHGDCIIPWLGIRNTCPVCRYELPTDDPDYERRRTQRAGHRVPGDSQVGFAIFSEQ